MQLRIPLLVRTSLLLGASLFVAIPVLAQPRGNEKARAKLEAEFAKTLSGATLDGRYTSTGPGADPNKLAQDKYTLGQVRKLNGNLWLIEARIQYGEHDVKLPITVPVEWAGDTPVIVVDNMGIPPFGAVSARVMFFGGHYAGYWSHGEHGGHLFGIIRPPGDASDAAPESPSSTPASRAEAPAGEQNDQ